MKSRTRTAASLLPAAGLLFLSVAFSKLQAIQTVPPRGHTVWETHTRIEGKSDTYRPGDTPRKFEEFLRPDWLKQPVDGFSSATGLSRLDLRKNKFAARWREAGKLGSIRIREVQYIVNDRPYSAALILGQRSDGKYAPIFKWDGGFPEIKAYRPGVMGFSYNYGGNVPMVKAWVWTATKDGPLFLEMDDVITAAIKKIDPAYRCYSTEFDWEQLYIQTACWPGEYVNKPSVKDGMEAWFEFRNGTLEPKKVVLRTFDEPDKIRVWP